MWILFITSVAVLGWLLVTPALAMLGIETPIQEAGSEIWSTLVPVTLGVISFVAAIASLALHHVGLFVTMLFICVLIFFVGFGIPSMITGAGLNWSF